MRLEIFASDGFFDGKGKANRLQFNTKNSQSVPRNPDSFDESVWIFESYKVELHPQSDYLPE